MLGTIIHQFVTRVCLTILLPGREVNIRVCFRELIDVGGRRVIGRVTADIDRVLRLVYPDPVNNEMRREGQLRQLNCTEIL